MDYKASQMARAAAAAALQAANPHLVPISACKGGSLIAASKNVARWGCDELVTIRPSSVLWR